MREYNDYSKKYLETLIKKIDNITDKRFNIGLLNDCYLVLGHYKDSIMLNHYDINNFCSELKIYSAKKHHFPNEHVRLVWKKKITYYLDYILENLENFNKK